MASNPGDSRPLRISDADRDAAMRTLRDHMVAGRLSLDEFDDRVGRALAAKTAADLEPLFADLPRDPDAIDGVSLWRAPIAPAKRRPTVFHTLQRWMIVLSPVLLLLLFTGWTHWWLAFVVWFVVAAVLSRADKAVTGSADQPPQELGR